MDVAADLPEWNKNIRVAPLDGRDRYRLIADIPHRTSAPAKLLILLTWASGAKSLRFAPRPIPGEKCPLGL
jgi:hypothetical protein